MKEKFCIFPNKSFGIRIIKGSSTHKCYSYKCKVCGLLVQSDQSGYKPIRFCGGQMKTELQHAKVHIFLYALAIVHLLLMISTYYNNNFLWSGWCMGYSIASTLMGISVQNKTFKMWRQEV